MEKLDLTIEQLLEVMEAAAERDEGIEGVTRQELQDALGWSGDRVLRTLHILKKEGLVRGIYARRENIVGVKAAVPAYELVSPPAKNGDEEKIKEGLTRRLLRGNM